MKKSLFKTLLTLSAFAMTSAMSLQAEPIYVLTSGNRLLTVDSATPGTVTKNVQITGLQSGETLHGMDFRPATGQLYALGSTARIYLIDENTGVATVSSTLTADAADMTAPFAGLDGTRFGVDFNPVPDRLRVVSDTDQSLRINVMTGATTTDGNLAYAASGDPNSGANPNVVGSAYRNAFSGALVTELYGIDSNVDVLVTQDPPNAGTLTTDGPLGVDTSDAVGFDISGLTAQAYASLTTGGTTNLYTINLDSGAATSVGAIGGAASLGTDTVVDIAALVNPGARLRNMSTRGRVDSGENILIAGIINRGGGPAGVAARYVIRAVGPGMSGQGVGTPLADPVLTLHDKDRNVIASNDDFSSSPDAAAITAAGLAPTDGKESAILVTLPANSNYTAQVTSKDGTPGVALVEVYELP
ncbi:MAG: hypothetical protein AVDCRST_MAG42-1081 [uncultured Chthoniobacterales bacterium]|uniref:DUF4394 domain-containing protein n=1 Tax=uncultured Chthoniobacterales bacterium TaxID=1836801 RepID=A0A6J4HQP4_9BACT|nr:MAG: hypothetical protein AVDCRST_MAG42-1081 [uncultured Chthoniobacterales bacterium]